VRHLAARNRGRTIGLYGGSFNPAHDGHRYIAAQALKRLNLDEVWFLVSPGNPLKPQAGMAPSDARFESLNQLIKHQPKMTASNLETRLGTLYTVDTVTALRYELPRTKFIWLMGADNLSQFDQWYRWETIAQSLPIAIFDRTGYAVDGFASVLARRYAKYRKLPQRFNATQIPSWTFMTIPRHDGSATELRNQHGEDWFTV
jgi:nicotinate-nucleotide adenylyltransferase